MNLSKKFLSIVLSIVTITSLWGFSAVSAESKDTQNIETGPTINQKNIVGWADYLYDIMWTAQAPVKGWEYTFSQGNSYRIPYSQPVFTNGYIGYGISVEDFINETNNADSLFYTSSSEFGETSTYYGMDCTSFVSVCWGIPRTTNFRYCSDNLGYINSNTVNNIQIGDALENSAHAVLITDVVYSGDAVSKIEVTEATPPQLTRSVWTANSFVSYYGSRDYILERYPGTVPTPPNGYAPEEPTEPPTQTPTEIPTEPATEKETVAPSLGSILGDADGDSVITILDVTIIQQHLATVTVRHPEIVEQRGDINQNGLDIVDATYIQKHLAGFDVPYAIGQPMQ